MLSYALASFLVGLLNGSDPVLCSLPFFCCRLEAAWVIIVAAISSSASNPLMCPLTAFFQAFFGGVLPLSDIVALQSGALWTQRHPLRLKGPGATGLLSEGVVLLSLCLQILISCLRKLMTSSGLSSFPSIGCSVLSTALEVCFSGAVSIFLGALLSPPLSF